MDERAREMFALLERCRLLPEVPEPLFRLLELLVTRVNGPWDPHETPTNPGGKLTPPPMPAVSSEPFKQAQSILEDAASKNRKR